MKSLWNKKKLKIKRTSNKKYHFLSIFGYNRLKIQFLDDSVNINLNYIFILFLYFLIIFFSRLL